MDLRQLETFIAVAKFKSFSKAASYLYLTQPTVSSHILNLEKELNTILVNRTNRRIALTKAGNILYDYALNIINLKEGAIFKLSEYGGKIVGTIEIAASSIPEQYILPEILAKFNKEYPDVTYRMLHYDSEKVVEGIINNELDFGIVGAKIPHNQLNYIQLLDDDLVLVTPTTEKYQSMGDSFHLEDIVKEKFIFRERGSGTRKIVESTLEELKINVEGLEVVAYIESTEAIKQCIRQGLGISFLSKRAVEDEVKLKVLKTFNISQLNLNRKFYFVYHKYRTPSPLEVAFQNFICSYFSITTI